MHASRHLQSKGEVRTLPSDAVLVTTLRAIGDGVISCDRDGRVVLMNAVAAELTGWSEEEATGHLLKDVFVILNQDTRQAVEDPAEKAFRLGRIVGLANHTLLVRRDGTEVAIDDSAAPVQDADGGVQGVVLVFRDVTVRRRAELSLELLSESGVILGEARDAATILHRIGAAASRHFADFCIFDLLTEGSVLQRIIGRHRDPAKQGVADRLQHFVPRPEDTTHPVRRALLTGQSLLMNDVTDEVMKATSVNGDHLAYLREQLHPRSAIVVPMEAAGEKLGAVSFCRNLLSGPFTDADLQTAKELVSRVCLALHYARVREALAAERAQLEAVLKAVPVGIIVADASGRIVRANEESEHILGHATRYSRSASDYGEYVAFHADGRQVKGEEYPLARALRENRAIRNEHLLYQQGDGTRKWVSLSATPVVGEAGRTLGAVVSISDIHELTLAQEKARRGEQRIQRLMNRASVGIAIGDEGGGLKYANDTLLRWIGYTAEDTAQGDVRWDRLTPSQYAAKDAIALTQLQETGHALPYEKAYVAKDGHLVPMLIGATMIPGAEEGDADDIAVFYTNLSLQKQAEAALLQTEKLTAVGRLASSISHEINNPLEAVTNLLFIVRNDPTLSQGGKDYLSAADRELARVSQVTSQTLRFHRQTTAATLVEPSALLEEVLSLYSSRLDNASIAISREYGNGVAVTCYEGDIRQVLNNLVSNAFGAMRGGGGHLRLRARYTTWWKTGQKGVCVTVADTGTGVPTEVRGRIFDAFFTTKGIHGTGLGLWISRRIVHKHRGHVRMKTSTEQGRHGTVFTLWLPLELAETARDAWYADSDHMSGNAIVFAGQTS